jgi:hypothetical protein
LSPGFFGSSLGGTHSASSLGASHVESPIGSASHSASVGSPFGPFVVSSAGFAGSFAGPGFAGFCIGLLCFIQSSTLLAAAMTWVFALFEKVYLQS